MLIRILAKLMVFLIKSCIYMFEFTCCCCLSSQPSRSTGLFSQPIIDVECPT